MKDFISALSINYEKSSQTHRIAIGLLLLMFALVYILPLDIRPLIIPDETRYAEIPREMIQSGDWVVPHLNGLRYFEKPPLGYWLNAVSIKLFGEKAFAVRLPSALSAGLAACFIWLLLIRSAYDRKLALWAAIIYLSFFQVLMIGTFAVLDTFFTLFLTAGVTLFYVGSRDTSSHRWLPLGWFVGSGALLGLAFLAKGFLAFVLPGIILFPWLLMERRLELWFNVGWLILGCLITVLPWAVLIHLQEPDYWRYFIWEEHIRRFLADDAQHTAPIYYYIAALPLLAFPWIIYFPACIQGFKFSPPQRSLLRLLMLWFWMPFLFFSVSKGKLATYILPCFVPLSIIVTVGISNYLQTKKSVLFQAGVALNIFILLIICSVFIYFGFFSETLSFPFYSDHEKTRLTLLLIYIALAALSVICSTFVGQTTLKMTFIALQVVPLYFAINTALPNFVTLNKSPDAFFTNLSDKISQNDIIISDGSIVRAVNWAFKRNDLYMLSQGELTYGLSYSDARHRFVDRSRFFELREQATLSKINIALFCKDTCPSTIANIIPSDAEEYSNQYFTLWLIRYAQESSDSSTPRVLP